ncbi:murein biosynthesis integral membrane protein MurJ [Rhodococcus jostii]|uniref:murein biosynthesis integral membrane protein MurJ n=1 Tax=Rhodococcus jostii TaxID=132919 RepID=UPI003635599C
MTDTEGEPSGHTKRLASAGGRVAVASTVSRATGFVRTVVIAAVLGAGAVADAYNGANTFPNMVYELLIGGVLASVLIPMLATAGSRGDEYGRQFAHRMVVALTIALAGLTLVAVVAAPFIAHLFVTDPSQRTLTTAFSYLLLPEIFFYGVTAVLAAVLNVRDEFGAAAWAPVVNNLVVILTAGLFLLIPGPPTLQPESMTSAQILVLGIGTTFGIVGQATVLLVALHRSGFRWFRRVRILPRSWGPIRAMGSLAGWVLGYVVASQIGVAVVMRVAFTRGGVSVFTYADLLFQVPFGIIAVSVLTVLSPRISRAMAIGDVTSVVGDLGRGARYLALTLVPVSAAMTILGPPVATVMFTGRVTVDQAQLIGLTLSFAAFGLLPLATVMLQMRVFYAAHDARTPTLINVVMVLTKVSLVALSANTLGDRDVILMFGFASSASYVVGALAGHLLLRRRYGPLGFTVVTRMWVRVSIATVIASAAAIGAMVLSSGIGGTPRVAAVVELISGSLAGFVVLILVANVLHIREAGHARRLLIPASRFAWFRRI